METNANNHRVPRNSHIRERKLSSIDAEISSERLRKMRGLNSRGVGLGFDASYWRRMTREQLIKTYGFNESR